MEKLLKISRKNGESIQRPKITGNSYSHSCTFFVGQCNRTSNYVRLKESAIEIGLQLYVNKNNYKTEKIKKEKRIQIYDDNLLHSLSNLKKTEGKG